MKFTFKTFTEYLGVLLTLFGVSMTAYGLYLQNRSFTLQSQPFFDVIYYETSQLGWDWFRDEHPLELKLNPEDVNILRPLGGQFFVSEKIAILKTPIVEFSVPTACDIRKWGISDLHQITKDDLTLLCEQDAPIIDAASKIIIGIALSNDSSVNITDIKIKFERYELTKGEPFVFHGVSEFYDQLAAMPSVETIFELPMIPNQGDSRFNQIYVPMFWYYDSNDNIALSDIYVPISVEFYNSQTQQTETQTLRLMNSTAISINTFVNGRG
ncbi:hypothetical protein [Vibrio alginolyticus]|uniref:hypothetical protein n=1 Tax=Vibrio alginolyticus TaxID=663 RepID=UPI001BD3F026|nr:hypothetical protein [Vibrio alginolyticus]MBT0094273.1 hypothetical protein [Vibrio alginolyticus]